MSPAQIEKHFQIAAQHHQAGQWHKAEALYREIIAAHPGNAKALHLIGLVACQTGRYELAVEWIGRAVALSPVDSAAYSDLGVAFAKLGRVEASIAAFRRAVEIKPDDADAYSNLGNALTQAGQVEEGIIAYRRALNLKPNSAKAYFNLGNALAEKLSWEEAVAAYRNAITLFPAHSAAHYNLGIALRARGEIYNSIAALRRAVELKPDHVDACINLGNALAEVGCFEEARTTVGLALELQPENSEAHYNLGATFEAEGKWDQAIAAYERALKFRPNHRHAEFSLALLQLSRGDFERGWIGYEARLEITGLSKRKFEQPAWRGESLAGKRLLIHTEQGFGDAIQFIRYVPMVAQRGARVIVECPRELVSLFSRVKGITTVVATGDRLPEFDLQLPMLSQPLIFRTVRETIPREVPYLSADPAKCESWRMRLGDNRRKFRVGLAWTGDPRHRRNLARSVSPEKLSSLFEMDGVEWHSIQIGGSQRTTQKWSIGSTMIDHSEHIKDFADTAALMEHLDLVISVDTAVTHLAGALGRPVWTLLPFAPDWRWGFEVESTPWYPTMRLFRQPTLGDWDSAIQRIAQELIGLVERRNSQS